MLNMLLLSIYTHRSLRVENSNAGEHARNPIGHTTEYLSHSAVSVHRHRCPATTRTISLQKKNRNNFIAVYMRAYAISLVESMLDNEQFQ